MLNLIPSAGPPRASADRKFSSGGRQEDGTGDRAEPVRHYRDLRALTGISCTGKHSTAYLEVGYVFNRELQYGVHKTRFDYDPGEAFLARVGWTARRDEPARVLQPGVARSQAGQQHFG